MTLGRACAAATFCLFVCLFGQVSAAADNLKLYYLTLPGLLEPDGTSGPFAFTLREISRRSGVTFQMQQMPMNRMIRVLQGNEPAAGVPQLGPMMSKRYASEMRLSPPVVFRCDYAFVRDGTPVPSSMEDIRRQVLVISPLTTLPPPIAALEGLTVLQAPSDEAAVTALATGRATLWINDETTTRAAIRSAGVTNITYDPTAPIFVWPAHIVYSAAVDAAVVARIDSAILSMARDGSMKEMLPQNFADQYERYLAGRLDSDSMPQRTQ